MNSFVPSIISFSSYIDVMTYGTSLVSLSYLNPHFLILSPINAVSISPFSSHTLHMLFARHAVEFNPPKISFVFSAPLPQLSFHISSLLSPCLAPGDILWVAFRVNSCIFCLGYKFMIFHEIWFIFCYIRCAFRTRFSIKWRRRRWSSRNRVSGLITVASIENHQHGVPFLRTRAFMIQDINCKGVEDGGVSLITEMTVIHILASARTVDIIKLDDSAHSPLNGIQLGWLRQHSSSPFLL